MIKIFQVKHIIPLFLLCFCSTNIQAQVRAAISIQNENFIDSDYYFDIYLNTLEGTEGDLFLAQSDFVLSYNADAFDNPEISKVENPEPLYGYFQNGYCDFTSLAFPEPEDILAVLYVQWNYYNNTSIHPIDASNFSIQLSSNDASSAVQLERYTANINMEENQHRLGRFKISHFTEQIEVNLQWVQEGKLATEVFTNITEEEGFETEQIIIEEMLAGIRNEPAIQTVESSSSLLNEVNVYPNPAEDIFFLDLAFNESEKDNIVVEIFDLNGRLVKTVCNGNCQNGIQSIDLGESVRGVYNLKVKNDKNSIVKKLLLVE